MKGVLNTSVLKYEISKILKVAKISHPFPGLADPWEK